jgi:hypothetical protein
MINLDIKSLIDRDEATDNEIQNIHLLRYVVFAYPNYYPSGGLFDAVYTSNDFGEIKKALKSIIELGAPWEYAYYHVLDMDDKRIIRIGKISDKNA